MTSFNIEAYLNSLPDDIVIIDVSGKRLTYLPDLSRFKNLKVLRCDNSGLLFLLPNLPDSLEQLWCGFNKLVSLPPLPNSLKILDCGDNKLVSLPPLPNSLRELYCENNQLDSLPPLPNSLKTIHHYDNLIYNIINSRDIDVIKSNIKTLNKFRYLYYCIKYKNKLRKWLWDIREKKVKEEFHPDRLREMLEGKNIDDVDFELIKI